MIERDIQNRIDIHGKMQKELLENKSVAAFLFLIPQGRELELSYNGTGAFVSMDSSKSAVSLWCANEEQAFEGIEELLGNAVIDGRRLIEIWDEITLDTLF